MAHFAEIDSDNKVLRVLVVDNAAVHNRVPMYIIVSV
jgi:hypothetical protein